MNSDDPVISVSGYRTDVRRDVACRFEHEGFTMEVHVPGAVAASEPGREHGQAKQVLLAAAEALVTALRRQ